MHLTPSAPETGGARLHDPSGDGIALNMNAAGAPRELGSILLRAKGTAVTSSTSSIPSLLQEQARQRASDVAILSPGRSSLTYEALWDQVQAVVGALQSRAVSNSTRVAVVLPNGPEMAVAFLAVSSCATCVPLNPASSRAEFRFYFEDIGAQILIARSGDSGPGRSCAEEMGLKIIEINVEPSMCAGQFCVDRSPIGDRASLSFSAPGDVALILHTSGTTARPKIVPLRHANLMASATNITTHLALTPGDRCLNVMPLFHIHGLVGALLSSLTAGGSIVCAPGFNDGDFFDWIAAFQPSWYTAVPTIHQSVVALASQYRQKAPRHAFRFVRSSSASLPPTTMKSLEQLFEAPVIEAYSMTEASHQMTSNALPPARQVPGSVGVAAGTEVAIMDEAGRCLAAGQKGEIVVRGASVIQGYENNPEANASAFTDGWFRTGDQGTLDEEGRLFILGRLKEIVNRGGEKVSPREVDEALLEHSGVEQVAAFGVPHPLLGEDLAAAVVRRVDSKVSEAELRQFLSSRLSEFKVPSRIVFVDTIPKGPTGKVQRMSLHDKLAAAMEQPFVGSGNDFEIGLATAWAEVLGVERVGVTDNFFALGGTSLSVLRLVVAMERATGVKFELGDIFRAPTIAALIATAGSQAAQAASVVVPLQQEGDGIPIFCLYGTNLYKAFAESLGKNQPVYGVYVREEQAIVRQVVDGASPEISIESLVQAYANAITRFRPSGPYRLAGFSFGGIMAIELATALRARGEAVDQVMLLDTVLAQGQRRNWRKWIMHYVGKLTTPDALNSALRQVSKHLLRRLGGRKQLSNVRPGAEIGSDIAGRQIAAFRRAASRWQPDQRAIDFRVVLFRALDKSRWAPYVELQDDYGWGQYLGDHFRIVDVPGAHRSIIEPPHVAELGRRVQALLGDPAPAS